MEISYPEMKRYLDEETQEGLRRIEEDTDFLEAPASTKYHLCRPGGLLDHSINVVDTLLRFWAAVDNSITMEQCVKVGLLHDMGKVDTYVKNDNDWEVRVRGIKYKVREGIYIGAAQRSLVVCGKYGISLTMEETQAILYHDGQFVDENKSIRHKECQLTLLLHYADYWSCQITENPSYKQVINTKKEV